MSNNIIEFPIEKIKKFNEESDNAEVEFADEYAQLILSSLFENLHRMGFDTKDKDVQMLPISFLVVESVKAFYLKSHGIYHPLQEVADEFFYEPEE